MLLDKAFEKVLKLEVFVWKTGEKEREMQRKLGDEQASAGTLLAHCLAICLNISIVLLLQQGLLLRSSLSSSEAIERASGQEQSHKSGVNAEERVLTD